MKLSRAQRLVVYIAGVIILIMLLYPPWRAPFATTGGWVLPRYGYGRLLWRPPSTPVGMAVVDASRLLAQCVAVVVWGGLLVMALHKKQE